MSFSRLIKGDCIKEMYAMEEKSIDLIITSPPYNKGYFTKCKKSNQIWSSFEIKYNSYNDNLSLEEYEIWMLEFLKCCSRVLKDNGSMFFNHKPIRFQNKIYHPLSFLLKCEELEIYQEIIWDRKSSPNIRNDIFVPCTERVYWLKKKGTKPLFNRNKINKEYIGEVWTIIAKSNKEHPAPFPEQLVQNCILPFEENITVLDPFMGSGTTGIVCAKLKRNFVGIEIDDKYFEVSERRIKETNEQLNLF